MRPASLLILSALFFAPSARANDAGAGGLEVGATIALPNAGVLAVGEPFTLIIEARHAAARIAVLPEKLDLGAELAERRSARRHSRSSLGDTEIDRYELELIAFSKGDLRLPEIPLAMGATTAATPPLDLRIESNFEGDDLLVATSTRPEAAAELERMAAANPAPRALVVPDYRAAYAAGFAVALAAIAFGIWRLSKRLRRSTAELTPSPPRRPAHETALARLDDLARSGLLEAGEAKRFMSELSEVMRAYAGERYGFDSLDLTLDELMAALSRRHTPSLDARALEAVLLLADHVKFAKLTPSAEECRHALESSRKIVRTTAPEPPPNGAGA